MFIFDFISSKCFLLCGIELFEHSKLEKELPTKFQHSTYFEFSGRYV